MQSADFATTWGKSNTTVSVNTTTSPDGGVNGDKIEETAVTGEHYVRQYLTGLTTNTTYTISAFVKAAERTKFRIRALDTDLVSNGYYATFDLSAITATGGSSGAGSVTGTPSITPVGNGWFRCVVSGNASTGTKYTIDLFLVDAAGAINYAGVAGEGLFLWGAQCELGSFPTSYIPTTTTALTRSADVASVNTLSPWFNATEGTIYAEAVGVNNVSGATRRFAEISDGTINDRSIVGYSTTTNTRFLTLDGNVTQADVQVTTGVSAGSLVKMATAYAVNDFQQASNGTLGTADTSGTLPTVNIMFLGSDFSSTATNILNGYLRRITYYPRRLSNVELQAITA